MMSTKVTHPDPMLADNDKTVAFLKEMVGEDEAKIAVIEEWGKKRQVRIEKLRRFVGLLEQNDLLRENGEELTGIVRELAATQCFAIATKNGLVEMGYRFRDSRSGPLCAVLHLDLAAAMAASTEPSTGLFASPKDEARFIETVRGKDTRELARMARPLVIEERWSIYD